MLGGEGLGLGGFFGGGEEDVVEAALGRDFALDGDEAGLGPLRMQVEKIEGPEAREAQNGRKHNEGAIAKGGDDKPIGEVQQNRRGGEAAGDVAIELSSELFPEDLGAQWRKKCECPCDEEDGTNHPDREQQLDLANQQNSADEKALQIHDIVHTWPQRRQK